MDFDLGTGAFLVGILNDVPEIPLVQAIMKLEGITYVQRGKELTFTYAAIEVQIKECLEWASNPRDCNGESLKVELQDVGHQRLASIRAWTGEVCYVVTSLLRARERTYESVGAALYFTKLFFAGLHKLPPSFVFIGELFRAESGVRTTWDETIKPGKVVQWFSPLSFSRDPKVMAKFMQSHGPRTAISIKDGCGYLLKEFSLYPDEDEVLTECITFARIFNSHKYDDSHMLVQAKQVSAGLHVFRACAEPGMALLTGSPAHAKLIQQLDRRPWNDAVRNEPRVQEIEAVEQSMNLNFDVLKNWLWASAVIEAERKEQNCIRFDDVLNTFATIKQVVDVFVADVITKIGGRRAIFVVGMTGGGKSTTCNWLAGKKIELMCIDPLDNKYEIVIIDEVCSISHDTRRSKTFLPSVVAINEDACVVDFAGFFDTDGYVMRIGMDIAFTKLVTKVKSAHILAVLPISSFLADGRSRFAKEQLAKIRRLLPACGSALNKQGDKTTAENSCTWAIGVTKCHPKFMMGAKDAWATALGFLNAFDSTLPVFNICSHLIPPEANSQSVACPPPGHVDTQQALMSLRKIAAAVDISEDEIDEADDSDNVWEALKSLVISKAKPSELKKLARVENVSKEVIDKAMSSGSPKDVLIDILTATSPVTPVAHAVAAPPPVRTQPVVPCTIAPCGHAEFVTKIMTLTEAPKVLSSDCLDEHDTAQLMEVVTGCWEFIIITTDKLYVKGAAPPECIPEYEELNRFKPDTWRKILDATKNLEDMVTKYAQRIQNASVMLVEKKRFLLQDLYPEIDAFCQYDQPRLNMVIIMAERKFMQFQLSVMVDLLKLCRESITKLIEKAYIRPKHGQELTEKYNRVKDELVELVQAVGYGGVDELQIAVRGDWKEYLQDRDLERRMQISLKGSTGYTSMAGGGACAAAAALLGTTVVGGLAVAAIGAFGLWRAMTNIAESQAEADAISSDIQLALCHAMEGVSVAAIASQRYLTSSSAEEQRMMARFIEDKI